MKKLFAVGLLVLLPWVSNAQDLPKSEINFGIGYMFEGEMYKAYFDQYFSVGETILLKLDYTAYIADFFGLGGYVTYGSPYYSFVYGEVSMAEFGVVLKPRFRAGDQLVVKFPVNLGYRSYGGLAGQGFGVNLSGVLEYQASPSIKPYLDIGIMTQPAGGNDATDITFGPTFALAAGVAFSF